MFIFSLSPSPPRQSLFLYPTLAFPEMRAALFTTALSLALFGLVLGGRVRFYAGSTCEGLPDYQESGLACGACVNAPDESSAALIMRVKSRYRVTVHNQNDCTDESVVLESFGNFCAVQAASKFRSVKIHCPTEAHRRRKPSRL
ncbi:hypothetical protein FRC08_001614 [Ceratobasidium sp. 394]|nr:hypothetical protein FRC08_001614 [Ceratobasidium sp. 394]